MPVYHLHQTLDYTELYSIVKKRMAIPTPLLETIATEMVEEIRSTYSEAEKISISIKKLYPPVNNFEGSVGISFEWNK
jgi:dihydroneopterin aldolase